MDNETSSSEIRELISEKAVALTRLKRVLESQVSQPLRSGGSEKPSRSLNDVELIGFGLAQLVVVVRFLA
jgi:hypothetical protein